MENSDLQMGMETLKDLCACENGYKFAKEKGLILDAWNTCQRGDWMLWFANKLGCPLQLFTLAKGKCAETVIHLMKDQRSINAVKVAIAFGNGNATCEELNVVVGAAYCAAEAASYVDVDAAAAAYVAAYAATTCVADNAGADDVAYVAAYADAAAADVTDYTAAKKENQLQTANICREILTDFVKSKIL